jgi:hypothetical protein
MAKRLVAAITAALVLGLVCLALLEGPLRLAATAAPVAEAPKAPQSLKPEDLDRLLGPIALYPDSLLSPMLLSAQNPGKVAALNEWLAVNQSLKGTELQDAATKAGFEPNFVALAVFPQVVGMMAGQMSWTTQLGEAFTADKSAVFGSIQRLRNKAKQTGTLKTNAQQEVSTKTTSSGQEVIVIEPSNPQVVYVPQYNPTVVYTQPASTTVVVTEDNTDEAVAAGLIGFTAGIAIGAAMDNNYYYGPYGMHGGFYMYDDAWDDWYDDREDAREDWYDNREDLAEERTERRENVAEERGDRAQTSSQQRTERQQNRQESGATAQAQQRRSSSTSSTPSASTSSATQTSRASGTSQESRGHSSGSGNRTTSAADRSGTKSDAFSGYSSGKSERAASSRGSRSRSSSSRSGGSRRR